MIWIDDRGHVLPHIHILEVGHVQWNQGPLVVRVHTLGLHHDLVQGLIVASPEHQDVRTKKWTVGATVTMRFEKVIMMSDRI